MNAISQYALTPAQRESLIARGLMHKPVPHLQAPAVVPGAKKYQAKRPVVCMGVYSSHGWRWNEDFNGHVCWRCGIPKSKRQAKPATDSKLKVHPLLEPCDGIERKHVFLAGGPNRNICFRCGQAKPAPNI